jgi:hypothetical protein
MNTILTKLKTSATLWSVVGGFVLGFANILWGADDTAASVSSAILFAVPAASYIVSKFALRIKMADMNNDGAISLQELAAALNLAASETSDEAKEVIDAVGSVIVTLANQVKQESTLVDQVNPDVEGEV